MYQQAMNALKNEVENTWIREKALQYLKERPDRQAIERLVDALEDDNFGVQWEASKALSSMGRDSLIVLTDPSRVGNMRLRNGAHRVLEHISIPEVNNLIWNLMTALKGPAADISTMLEAYKLL